MEKNGKWALITGASSGIGKEFCNILGREKWNLVLVARREPLLMNLKEELQECFGIKVEIKKADLTQKSDVEEVVELLKKFQVSYLINNAGMLSRGELETKGLEELDRLINLNIVSLVQLTHGAIKHFKQFNTDCYLLNVGSLNSFISTGHQAVYCGSKAFVKSFTLAVAEELRGSNVKVSCLCPGGTESEIMEAAGAEITASGARFVMSARSVAQIGIDAMKRDKLVVVPGWYNKVSVFFSRIIPERTMTRISSKVLKSAVRLKQNS